MQAPARGTERQYDEEHVEPTATAMVLRAHITQPPADIRDVARQLLIDATGVDEPRVRSLVLDDVRAVDQVHYAAADDWAGFTDSPMLIFAASSTML
jgi:hypothetical protein